MEPVLRKHGIELTYTENLDDLNAQAFQWCDEIANRKAHSTTGQAPFERLQQERAYLKPLTVAEPFYVIEERRATKTQLISVEGNRYSVPPMYAQKRVRYRRYEDRIELLKSNILQATSKALNVLNADQRAKLSAMLEKHSQRFQRSE